MNLDFSDQIERLRAEEAIKALVKSALKDGVTWTDKQFAAIRNEAVREAADETARKLYGATDD